MAGGNLGGFPRSLDATNHDTCTLAGGNHIVNVFLCQSFLVLPATPLDCGFSVKYAAFVGNFSLEMLLT